MGGLTGGGGIPFNGGGGGGGTIKPPDGGDIGIGGGAIIGLCGNEPPHVEEDVGDGIGLTVGLAFAASNAFILASLSSFPANIIPDSVPVKNVAIGIINSKNF